MPPSPPPPPPPPPLAGGRLPRRAGAAGPRRRPLGRRARGVLGGGGGGGPCGCAGEAGAPPLARMRRPPPLRRAHRGAARLPRGRAGPGGVGDRLGRAGPPRPGGLHLDPRADKEATAATPTELGPPHVEPKPGWAETQAALTAPRSFWTDPSRAQGCSCPGGGRAQLQGVRPSRAPRRAPGGRSCSTRGAADPHRRRRRRAWGTKPPRAPAEWGSSGEDFPPAAPRGAPGKRSPRARTPWPGLPLGRPQLPPCRSHEAYRELVYRIRVYFSVIHRSLYLACHPRAGMIRD
ncbi:collagen alpha-1(I) chain-like isoform X1 [Canis lupus familiaris]|uniref:collagen alpha-1(I) chain-like isoform X1 n=1 Tax=Canis lupus familiaris TaxID=9615 RepID=UPI0018F7DAB3|nr:collagen alpha-1(I) chain-like isoform X1 [Canis lupus familiaris]